MSLRTSWLWIVSWHSGDGDHAYDDEVAALQAIRYHRERSCTFIAINWRTGERREVELPAQA